jgi:hypothetical protein
MSKSSSTIHVHIADTAKVTATHGINLDTATLGIEADGNYLSVFIWGEPEHVWESLDAIIDACAALKVDIAKREANPVQPPAIHVV